MREKVAVATVEGKAYFLIVNRLRERNVPFVSLVPGDQVAPEVKVLITTRKELPKVKHEKILVLTNENEIDDLVDVVERTLQGKKDFEKIIIGIDPGEAIGLAAIADGKVIEESNCFSEKEVINTIINTIRNINFSETNVSVKIGNGVPIYRDLLQGLDESLPSEVKLEVVNEAGTNKPLKENKRSRRIRHISSAKRIAGRTGCIIPRKRSIVTNS